MSVRPSNRSLDRSVARSLARHSMSVSVRFIMLDRVHIRFRFRFASRPLPQCFAKVSCFLSLSLSLYRPYSRLEIKKIFSRPLIYVCQVLCKATRFAWAASVVERLAWGPQKLPRSGSNSFRSPNSVTTNTGPNLSAACLSQSRSNSYSLSN